MAACSSTVRTGGPSVRASVELRLRVEVGGREAGAGGACHPREIPHASPGHSRTQFDLAGSRHSQRTKRDRVKHRPRAMVVDDAFAGVVLDNQIRARLDSAIGRNAVAGEASAARCATYGFMCHRGQGWGGKGGGEEAARESPSVMWRHSLSRCGTGTGKAVQWPSFASGSPQIG